MDRVSETQPQVGENYESIALLNAHRVLVNLQVFTDSQCKLSLGEFNYVMILGQKIYLIILDASNWIETEVMKGIVNYPLFTFIYSCELHV